MYLRFSVLMLDDVSRRPQGVFQAALSLLSNGELSREEWLLLREDLDWFNEFLPAPPEDFPATRAVFWFRAEIQENIERMWNIVHVLREHGRPVEVSKCRHLHNIVYRDKYQVAAYPSPGDSRITLS